MRKVQGLSTSVVHQPEGMPSMRLPFIGFLWECSEIQSSSYIGILAVCCSLGSFNLDREAWKGTTGTSRTCELS